MSSVSALDALRAARTIVELPAGRGYADVASLVIGGVAARFELPIDRVDDLLLAVDSLLMQEVVGETAHIEADASPTGLVVRLGPYPAGQLDDASLRRILTRLVDTVAEVRTDGRDGAWIELGVAVARRHDGK